MYKPPCVSVIIVNWERKDDLKGCLESVLNQTFKDIELIVVDNHSTDGSIEMLREEYPAVKLIVMPDSSYGACEAFNIGFANAVGQFCLVLDNDALLESNWATNALREFGSDPQLGCLAGRVLNYHTGRDWGFEIYGLNDAWHEKEFFTSVFVGCSAIVRKDVLDKVGGYPPEYFLYWNELALGARIVNAGFKVKYVPDLVAYHKVAGSQRSRRGIYYGIRNGYWYFWTYYPLWYAIRETFIHFFESFGSIVRDPVIVIKAHADALRGLPAVVEKRQPVADEQILRPFLLDVWRKHCKSILHKISQRKFEFGSDAH